MGFGGTHLTSISGKVDKSELICSIRFNVGDRIVATGVTRDVDEPRSIRDLVSALTSEPVGMAAESGINLNTRPQ